MKWWALLAGVVALSAFVRVGQVEAQSTLGAPTASVSSPSTDSLTVTWTAPSDNGGAAITAYYLRYIPTDDDETDDTNWTLKTDAIWETGGGTLTYTLDGLEDGVGYDVQVRAENANDDVGPWSTTAAGTTTDHSGSATAAATDLTLGSSVAGQLTPATDEDVFEITLGADGEVWIYTSGPLDTFGELLNSGGTVVAEANGGTLLNSRRSFELREELTAGTYYVRVSSYEDRATGSYRIHAQTVTDPGSTAATAATVTLDSATPGHIGSSSDEDYFKLVLDATTDVWVMAFGKLGTEGELLDSGESRLTSADDSRFFGNSKGFMLRRSLGAGTYYIKVSGDGATDTGPYTLHVRTAAEPGSTTATAVPLTLEVAEVGRISSGSDQDFFSLTMAEDTYVYIEALTFGSALPLTPAILDSMGTEVSMHIVSQSTYSGHGRSYRSFSVWGKLEAGTYHLRVSSSGGSTGMYLLDPVASPYNQVVEDCTAITTTQSDPLYGCQWHLKNTGQFGTGAGQDINVESVWAGGNKGEGINIALLEDSLQTDHEDLVDNILTARNRDLIGQGNVYHPLEFHGTAIAGLIAARDNDIGVRGVAPRANIFIYDITRGNLTNSTRAIAGTYHAEDAPHTAISNNSWGPSALGIPREVEREWEEATRNGVTLGYGGKGILYVWSGGNGHLEGDHSNLAERVNYYTGTTVCAVGYDDLRAEYSEMGANLWLCAPAQSGRDDHPWITTTHIPHRYQTNFGSTSGAAAIVSGVAALVRAANTDLTWRDVKLILAASARKNDATNTGWEQGALEYGSTTTRYDFNHEYGFGMVDAAAAVALADGWTNVPATLRTSGASSGMLGTTSFPGVWISDDGTTAELSLSLDGFVSFIEFVEIETAFRHDRFRDLQVELVSPSGTVSELSVPASSFSGQAHFYDSHRFGSAKHLGESAEGTWTLRLTDKLFTKSGRLMSWSLKVYGHGYTPGPVSITSARSGAGLATLAWDEPADIGGSAITSYDLRYRKLPDTDWTTVTDVGTLDDRTYTLTGLDGTVDGRNVAYVIQIRAVNDAGGGRWSATSSVQPWRVAPDAPRSVSTAARNEALAVSWQTPNYWGAQPLVAYHIRYIEADATDKSDSEWTTVSRAWQTGGGELRYVIRGLANGTEYEVQVQAENIRTTGGWSSVARGTPANVNGPAEFPGTSTTRSIPENTPAGVDIGDPISARDDEGDTRTYSLTSGAANFDIVSTSGQLQTKVALDRERTSSYSVTVAVHDGKASDGTESTATDDTIRVTINIEDVDEPPVVTGSATRTVRENSTAVATYSASDPEGATTTFTWSLAGADSDDLAISSSGVLTFDPAPNFEAPTDTGGDNTYNVTIRATDDSATDPDAMTGEFDVSITVQPVDEPPEISGDTSYTIAENSARRVGSYTATDPEGASTTWLSLTGTDAQRFTLDEFGTLSFKDTPDYDPATNGNHGPEYQVTLRASDGRTGTAGIGTLPVTITLTPVAEGPLIEGDTVITVNEGHTGTLDTYTKRDPEGSATNWGAVGSPTALSGANADALDFDQSTGRLSFKSPPDFEDGGGSYQVTINANDGVLDSSLDVTVNVTNLDERADQPVQLGAQRGVINVALTATLTDPDNVVSATWQWQRSTSRTGGWADIANTDSGSYTPTAADRDHYLRATVSYEDGHSAGKSADAVTEFTTANERGTNTAPVLPDSVDNIPIPENAAPGRSVGSPVRATDGENDPLVYTLSGASQFEIGRTTGQIRVAAGAVFDYDQGQRSYSLTVTADDGFGGSATVAVTVNIEDVNEVPVAAGDAPSVAEDGTIEIDVLANDSDPENDTLSLASALPSSPRFGIATVDASTNRISYTPRANYHGPDSFSYRVQDDGSPRLSSTAIVSITVDSVNDAPAFPSATVERRVSENAEEGDSVGAPVTATDVDTGDMLSYSLSGPDAFSFDIDGAGQITVAAGVTFEIATKDTYEVTVTVDDGSGGSNATASVAVTITVTAGPVGPLIVFGGGGGGPSGPSSSEVDFEWTVEHDIEELAGGHEKPSGSWSDGVTLWLLDNPDGAGDAVYAYDLRTGERVEDREFDLDDTNRAPRGVWSDGKTFFWVSDSGQDRLFAHDIATRKRTPERDIELDRRNADARGIWSDGATMWVLDGGKDALFVYDLESGALLGECALDQANSDPRGIWSDHTTVWVSNHDPKRLFAYRLPTRRELAAAAEDKALERVSAEEFGELSKAGNNSPRGLWSDGDVMYVADANDGKAYSYNMPDAIDARLASLELTGVDIGEFSPLRYDYTSETIPHGNIATLTAVPAQEGATVKIEPPDHDGDPENGHHLRLLPGLEITVTVTSEDRSRELVYRLLLGDEEPTGEEDAAGPAPDCLRGAVAVGFSLVVYEGGSVEDLVACAERRHVTALYALRDGEYVPYILGAPDFVNASFADLFAEGVPALLPLVVRSEGPAAPAPVAPEVTEPFATCLRGDLAEGFSLVLYEGGSVADLEACAAGLGVTAVYVLADGEWVTYILSAPEFVNARFNALFPDRLPVATPLTVRGAGQ
ncbi:MAG: cadherin domain-containing protein [Chloroflexi bacterium]|nr:cadherin domain-containing protein [Chloroflexota bacterium]